MATIETAIRAMLVKGTTLSQAGVADANVTHGYRQQFTTLPAVTYEVDLPQTVALGDGMKSADVRITIVAPTADAALAIVDEVEAVCVVDTYDTIVFSAVVWRNAQAEPTVTAEGDEAQPAQVTCHLTVYYEN